MPNSYTAMPWVLEQFFDANGDPASSYRLFTYSAGTSTKLTTYQVSTLGSPTAHSNPITLDSAGRPPAAIFLQAASYKFVLAPPGSDDPPSTTVWTVDNVSAVPPFNVDVDVAGTAGEALSLGDCVYCSAGDGSRTQGSWYKADADLDYASVTSRMIGFVTTAATGAGVSTTVRRMGRLTGLSGLTPGSLYYASATAGGITSTAPSNTRRVGFADSATTLLIAAEIPEPLKGYIPIDLTVTRELSAGAIQNAAANGGILASDTTPILERVNGATDQALRLNWAAANVDVITWSFSYPPDWDDANDVTVHLLAASGGATNSPTMGVAYFEGVGDSDAGGATAAITGTTVAEYTRTITAANIGPHPNFASVSLTPAAHGTDALFLYAIWIEYVRKLKST